MTAISYFMADCDLSFNMFEKNSFAELVSLCNPLTKGLLLKKGGLSSQLDDVFSFHKKYLLDKYLSEGRLIAYTLDGWTSPNITAYTSITCHFISDEWEKIDVILAIPHMQGAHTGLNFAGLFMKELQTFSGINNILAITTDNASANGVMAQEISRASTSFDHEQQHFGCVAHVLNLAAKAALDSFSCHENLPDVSPTFAPMSISNLVDEPDGTHIELKSLLSRVHGLSTYVRQSPQRKEKFERVVSFSMSPEVGDYHGPSCLILDVETRWNSTFLMLERALLLRPAYDQFTTTPEAQKYSINPLEWEKITQMVKFLQPLNEATNKISATSYPTLSMVLPLYVVVMNQVRCVKDSYDSVQLLPAAESLMSKLDQYLNLAFKKNPAICATILDPRLKMKFFRTHFDSVAMYGTSLTGIESCFEVSAESFVQDEGDSVTPSSNLTANTLDDEMFGEATTETSVALEIQRYLAEPTEPKEINVLHFWKARSTAFPTLAAMAQSYLAIPATSTPSERVFSEGRNILRYQRSSLSPRSFEKLVCVKEWYRTFGPLYSSALAESLE